MLLTNNGGTVDASGEHAKVLLASGWRPVEESQKKPAPRKRAARKPKTTE